MIREEIIADLITQFSDYQEIKRDNDNHENKTLDYKIKVIASKLESLGINVENLHL